ncbi:MAG TPA: peptidase C14 [Cyanobacteria bacterium UBA8543]|nr:peptidase C14 [Cyanobacteria bacterium UBA8543]
MKRRHFLQFSSSLFASLGLSQLDLMHQANRYAQVLAQSTPRKLALLVGINDYQPGIGGLRGCLTDVEMQRELLVHRFGFNPKDILEVTNAQATRQGILAAFDEHLVKQAKPGDVVVFHYSGHGSRVRDPNPIGKDPFNSTMVPVDRPPDSVSGSAKSVPDIMGHTLFLLMSAIPTENLTVVLDSCYSGGGKRGNVIVRSARLASDVNLDASPEEFEYQKQLLSKLNLPADKFLELRRQGVAKGVVIASARRDQQATDAPFEGFHAGAFTYLMTRYLWQESSNSSFDNVFVNLARRTKDVAQSSNLIQDPEFEVKPGSNNGSKPLYFLEKTRPAAEAVIRKVTGNQVEFWLGGIASQSLEAFKDGAVFTIIDDKGQEQGQIKQESRVGLVGYGKVVETAQQGIVKEGTLLRERVRGIPTDLALRLGVDETLGAEKEKARAALQGQKRIELVSVEQRSVADYLFGRVTQEDFQSWQKQGVSNPAPVGALGLFTASRQPISSSFGQVGESAENAVLRLRPRLKVLLVGRILKGLVNGDSSQLNVTTSIQSVDGTGTSGTVSSRGTRSVQSTLPAEVKNTQKLQFKRGTKIQAQVKNNESRNIYASLLFITGSGDILNLFPLDWDAPEEKALVAPGQSIAVPQPEDKFVWNVGDGVGTFEVLIIASVAPLRNALKGLQNIARGRQVGRGSPLSLNEDEPVEIIGNLLGDIDTNSRSATPQLIPKGVQAVGTGQLAAISTVVEVVE